MNVMGKGMNLSRMSASLLLRAMLVGLAVLVSNAVPAEGSFLLNPNFNDLKEGDVLLAPIGQRGAGVRMSMDAPGQNTGGSFKMSNNGIWQINDGASEVYMSLVIPW